MIPIIKLLTIVAMALAVITIGLAYIVLRGFVGIQTKKKRTA